MKKIVQSSFLGITVVLLLADSSQAGGLYLYEIGSPDVGLAAAGYAARAQDASTVYTNPAGMTRLASPTMMAGAQPMYLHLSFSPDSDTSSVASTLPGGETALDGNSNGVLPAGGLFYVQPVNDKVWFGLSLSGNFGLALDYADDWVGRYYVQETSLQAASIQPTLAYKMNDQFSVGAGVGILYGMFDDKVAINNINPLDGDGRLKLSDEDWSVQFNLGLMYEPTPGTRLGLTYLSEADLNFSDNPEFKNLGNALEAILNARGALDSNIDLGMTVPQAVMFSIYHELNDKLALMGNVGWQDWSEFGKVDVSIYSDNTTSLTTQLDYNDTWHVALGAQYRLSQPWMLTAGIAYDSAMMDDDQISPSLPVSDTWRFGLGAQYEYSENLTFGASYVLAWSGDIDMDVSRGPLAGEVSGTYENTSLQAVCLNVEYRF